MLFYFSNAPTLNDPTIKNSFLPATVNLKSRSITLLPPIILCYLAGQVVKRLTCPALPQIDGAGVSPYLTDIAAHRDMLFTTQNYASRDILVFQFKW